jgi:hypothetical protein
MTCLVQQKKKKRKKELKSLSKQVRSTGREGGEERETKSKEGEREREREREARGTQCKWM